jgi:hypothetical protein
MKVLKATPRIDDVRGGVTEFNVCLPPHYNVSVIPSNCFCNYSWVYIRWWKF